MINTFKNAPLRLSTLFAITIAVLLTACGDDDDANGATSDGQRTIVVIASDQLRFDPATIRIKVGEIITIELDNSGAQVLHDWNVDDINAVLQHSDEDEAHDHEDPAEEPHNEGDEHDADDHVAPAGAVLHLNAAAGEVHSLVFTVEEPRTYAFFCSVPGHRQGGMEGTIIVEN